MIRAVRPSLSLSHSHTQNIKQRVASVMSPPSSCHPVSTLFLLLQSNEKILQERVVRCMSNSLHAMHRKSKCEGHLSFILQKGPTSLHKGPEWSALYVLYSEKWWWRREAMHIYCKKDQPLEQSFSNEHIGTFYQLLLIDLSSKVVRKT